ncbi:RING-type domain-containing protein [Haematococcus lacustris]|uniref:RING-type domain-containing protein n=1 Tax=Haematococcus lacustris TaxID=44745 RepID=A0A699YHA2_HAELA|nr:RING-type domain-containing protein [Haematococcus lacustris]
MLATSSPVGGHPAEGDELDPDGAQLMSKRLVQRMCRAQGLPISPECCTQLYLNGCRFRALHGLEEYVSVRVLHLENNCLTECNALVHMTGLRALYLQQNALRMLTWSPGLEH